MKLDIINPHTRANNLKQYSVANIIRELIINEVEVLNYPEYDPPNAK